MLEQKAAREPELSSLPEKEGPAGNRPCQAERLYDSTTGLPTPALLRRCCARLLASPEDLDQPICLLLIDLPDLPELDPSLREIVTSEVHRRLMPLLTAGETIACAGPGRYVLLLGKVAHTAETEATATRIQETLSEIRVSESPGDCLTVTLGFATTGERNVNDFDSLLARAEQSLTWSQAGEALSFHEGGSR